MRFNIFRRKKEKSIKETLLKNTKKERAFVKYPRNPLKDVSSKRTIESVNVSERKRLRYILEVFKKDKNYDPKKEYELHTHILKKDSKKKTHLPSIQDIHRAFLKLNNSQKKINVMFLTNEKGIEIGRVHYKIDLKIMKNTIKNKNTHLKKYMVEKINETKNKDIVEFYKKIGVSLKFVANKKEGFKFNEKEFIFEKI